MFEDIYKKIDSTSSSPVSFSVDFKEEHWEEIKKDPKELGNVITTVVNFILCSTVISRNHKMALITFEFIDEIKKLQFNFELYDMDDEDQRKTYLDSLDPEERKWYEL
jgi:hypothetical protein